MPWRARGVRPLLLRRRAGRPQLKRDPLGGARPLRFSVLLVSVVPVLRLTGTGMGVPQNDALEGTWRLVRVGSRAPAYYIGREPCAIPSFEEYRFQRGRWVSRDTFRLKGPNGSCAGFDGPADGVLVRSDSGTYRIAGDTIHLYAADSLREGSRGWLGFSLLRADTLRSPQGEFHPGDYIYIRVRVRR